METKRPTNIQYPNAISCGVTWISGEILFKHDKHWSQCYYGVCHYSKAVFNLTPLDYFIPSTAINTILVSPKEKFCEKCTTCLYFKCPLNRFQKDAYLAEFKGMGAFTLGLPLDFGSKDIWFNEGKYRDYWGKLMKYFKVGPEGGVLKFNHKSEAALKGKLD